MRFHIPFPLLPQIVHHSATINLRTAMTSTLANLYTCVPKFQTDNLTGEWHNTEKQWRQWVENFECCLNCEGIVDPHEGNSKKRAALIAIRGQQLDDLFRTVNTYDAARTIVNKHFTSKENLTAKRYKFFCTKPLGPEKSHDRWITQLGTLHSSLVITSEKLETVII